MERFYLEGPFGERLPVTEDQWNVDRHDRSYQQVIAQPGLTIYKIVPRLTHA